MNTNRAAVLPRPVLNVSAPPSTKRFVVLKHENLDFEKYKQVHICDHVVIFIYLEGSGGGIWGSQLANNKNNSQYYAKSILKI